MLILNFLDLMRTSYLGTLPLSMSDYNCEIKNYSESENSLNKIFEHSSIRVLVVFLRGKTFNTGISRYSNIKAVIKLHIEIGAMPLKYRIAMYY